jgi:hypothetical protein
LKLDAHIINARRVGCWTRYNEDGALWAEWDYMDGKALHTNGKSDLEKMQKDHLINTIF